VQKDALLEVQGDALRSAETALEERGASVSAFLQQVDAARAELDEERRHTEGKYRNWL